MLARDHRLTSGRDFAEAIRRGRRAGTATVVLHLVATEEDVPPRLGLVVGKAVGGAVVRNQVKRRLRHLIRGRLATLPRGAVLVARALPPAGVATSVGLGSDVDRALSRLEGQARNQPAGKVSA